MSDKEYEYPQDEYVDSPETEAAHPDAYSHAEEVESNSTSESAVAGDAKSAESNSGDDAKSSKLKSVLANFLNKCNAHVFKDLFTTTKSRIIAIIVVVLVLISCIQSCSHKSVPVKPAVVKHSDSELPSIKQTTKQAVSDANVAKDTANSNVDKINHLQQQLDRDSKAIAMLGSSQEDLADTMKQMNKAMQAIAKRPVSAHASAVKKVVAKKPHKVMAPTLTYQLQAIVPGRAWLKDSRGIIHTVTRGDKLAGYGVIQYLDADHGEVITSLGKVIGYPDSA